MRRESIFRLPGVLPVFSIFFAEAVVLGNWIPRIPDVKLLFDFSASQLGQLLLVMSSGTLVSFLFGGAIIKRWGLRKSLAISSPLWALLVGALPFASNGVVLAMVGFCAGISVGMMEIAMNTAADRLERQSGRRLMSKAHGFWSLGSLAGALCGAQFAALGISVDSHFAIVMPVIAVGSIIASLRLSSESGPRVASGGTSFKLPNRAIILLCIMPIGIMLIEGAFIDWSALFVRDVLAGGPWAIGSIFAAFATVMAATRLSGDLLLDRFGSLKVARVSALSATLGIAIFSFAPNVPIAFLGALFSGLGVAIFYPLTMSAAARRPGDEEDNVAAMSLFAFTSFMIAPPVIGFLADGIGLRYALALLIPIAATSFMLSGELEKGES